MTTALRSTMVALAFVGVATVGAQAQSNNASIQATAEVQQPIDVSGQADLVFGNVFPGVNKTIAVTDGGAGLWGVTGQESTPVQLTFGLPATLSDGGANTLPIGTFTGHWNNVAGAPTGGTDFTPAASPTTSSLGAAGTLFVYIGATVNPATNQAAGTYSGSLSMTVVYF